MFPPATGFASTGSIDLGGNGTNKRGIVIQGGNTFYGPITLTNLTAVDRDRRHRHRPVLRP